MQFLISFYDNALIYYPNVFFAVLFSLSILITVLTIKGVIYLNREFRKIVREIKNDIGKIKINKIGIKKTKIDKKFFIKILTENFKNVLKTIGNIFIGINAVLGYLQFKIEEIFKKIGKEIFIQE